MPNLVVVGQIQPAIRPYEDPLGKKTWPLASRLSRSLKVLGADMNRPATCDFLVVIYIGADYAGATGIFAPISPRNRATHHVLSRYLSAAYFDFRSGSAIIALIAFIKCSPSPYTYYGPANRKIPFESNFESNRRLRFEFESNLEPNQGVVVYMFNADCHVGVVNVLCYSSTATLNGVVNISQLQTAQRLMFLLNSE